jgi:subtilisin family serine protease
MTMPRSIRAVLVLAALLIAPGLRAQAPDAKIDPKLLAAFAASPDGTAPFFVVLKSKANLTAASRIAGRIARGRAVVGALKNTASASQLGLRALLQARGVSFTPYWVQNTIYVSKGNLALARLLAARTQVDRITAEPVFSLSQSQSPPLTSNEWNIRKIRADQAWPTSTGTGVVVAAIDSGVRYTHAALRNQYRGNSGGSYSHAGNWYDPTGYCGASPCDNVGHGTRVMGVLAGSDGTNNVGVAPGAAWIACKGCSSSSACYGDHLLACAQWIMDPNGDGSGSGQPDIVNNSWSGPGGDTWFLSFVDSWRAAGIFPVFAAGNSGPVCGSVRSPGDYVQSTAVGATNSSDVIASGSSRGPSIFGGIKPDLTAPGVNIRSTDYVTDTSYFYTSGTSFASPHVAGTVALVWSAAPALRGDITATEQLLAQTAVPIQSSEDCGGTAYAVPNNTYGAGRVDALSAVLAATPAAPVAVEDAYSVQEDGSLSAAAQGVLGNDTGGSEMQAVLVSGAADGTVTLNGDGSFTYAPRADFNGADQFTYQASSGGLESNIATVRITVSAVNDAPAAAADAAETTEGTPVTIAVLANDSDVDSSALEVTNLVVSSGTAVVNADQTVTYTPAAGFSGVATFTYTASDGQAESSPATVTVNVSAAVNVPPVANDDAATTTRNVRVTINVVANDTDSDGVVVPGTVVAPVRASMGGTIVNNANGTLTFTPRRNWRGTDSFTYTVKDDDGAVSNAATVRVIVN